MKINSSFNLNNFQNKCFKTFLFSVRTDVIRPLSDFDKYSENISEVEARYEAAPILKKNMECEFLITLDEKYPVPHYNGHFRVLVSPPFHQYPIPLNLTPFIETTNVKFVLNYSPEMFSFEVKYTIILSLIFLSYILGLENI